jgi:hypothetical protein
VERLFELLKKRALIEREMLASAKRMEKAFQAASRELQVALEARLQDMNEST